MDADEEIRAAGSGRKLGRYVLYDAVAAGGMASVHFGRLVGPVGFARTVAIKRLHAHHARDPEFVAMFLDEARLAARIRHPNVVSTLDVVTTHGEVFLVMDYVQGESLQGLLRVARTRATLVPLPVISSIVCGMLHGLHAAHEARSEHGEPLQIVHRDVSPQNVLVGEDGIARLADFGIAKAAWREQSTRDGVLKGKLSYMAPEQFRRGPIDRRADIYAASVVLWEALAGRKLQLGDDLPAIMASVMTTVPGPPSGHRADVPAALDAVVLRGLSANPDDRFETALAMATELERVLSPAPQGVVAAWVRDGAAEALQRRAARLATIESTPSAADAPAEAVPLAARTPSDSLRNMSAAVTAPGEGPAPAAVAPSSDDEAPGMSSGARPPRARDRGPRAVILALALGAVLGLLGAVSASRWGRQAPPSSAPIAAASTAAAIAPADPAASAPPQPSPAPGLASAAPSAVAAAPNRPAPARKAASDSPRKDCDPPYTLDPSSKSADGQPVKRFKVWCL